MGNVKDSLYNLCHIKSQITTISVMLKMYLKIKISPSLTFIQKYDLRQERDSKF